MRMRNAETAMAAVFCVLSVCKEMTFLVRRSGRRISACLAVFVSTATV